MSVWLALDDMTEQNGTICVLPQTRMERREPKQIEPGKPVPRRY